MSKESIAYEFGQAHCAINWHVHNEKVSHLTCPDCGMLRPADWFGQGNTRCWKCRAVKPLATDCNKKQLTRAEVEETAAKLNYEASCHRLREEAAKRVLRKNISIMVNDSICGYADELCEIYHWPIYEIADIINKGGGQYKDYNIAICDSEKVKGASNEAA